MEYWGIGALRANRLADAEEAFQEALAHDAGSVRGALGMMVVCERQGRTEEMNRFAELAQRCWRKADGGTDPGGAGISARAGRDNRVKNDAAARQQNRSFACDTGMQASEQSENVVMTRRREAKHVERAVRTIPVDAIEPDILAFEAEIEGLWCLVENEPSFVTASGAAETALDDDLTCAQFVRWVTQRVPSEFTIPAMPLYSSFARH